MLMLMSTLVKRNMFTWMLLWMLVQTWDVDVDSDKYTDEKKQVARTRGDAEARILSRSWYPLCGAEKDAQPTREAKQGEWRGAKRKHGAHVHE